MGFVPLSGTGRQFLLVAKGGRREVGKAFVGIALREEGGGPAVVGGGGRGGGCETPVSGFAVRD